MSDLPPLSELRAAMDPFFNGVIVEGFLCGVYTLLIAQALWKLWRKGSKGLYSCALIVLWIAVFGEFVIDWLSTRSGSVVNNTSPLAIWFGDNGEGGSASINILLGVAILIFVFISDAILIWRCHMLWHNAYILIVLVTLLVATTGLTISNNFALGHFAVLVNSLRTFATFITTVTATSLIVLKIALVTRRSHMHHSFRKTITILIESAGPLFILLLGSSILQLNSYIHLFVMNTTAGRTAYQISQYLTFCQGPITGIAPTLIAFRVTQEPSATEVNSTNWTGALSRLTFRRTAHGTSNNSQATHAPAATTSCAPSHGEEHVSCIQAPMDIEVQKLALNEQGQKFMEKVEDYADLGSV